MQQMSFFIKPLCRFLIHRYVGQYLKTELTSDQLEFHLADGTAKVQGVMLNTEYINETLDASGVKIVTLVDGYVAELTVCVPWTRLHCDSTIIKVRGLQITLTPLADINMMNTQELVSSFIGSIASSMDLARSVVDEKMATEADSGGIEQFAYLIDQIISRIKVIFENTTIRIESYSDVAGLSTGIEIQIDKIEFLDENLQEETKNANEAITEQPTRLYTVTDLNKLLHIQGVRLYTDIWTPLKIHKLTTSQINSSDSEGDSTDMAHSSLNYQSCYSHFSSRSNSNTISRPQNSIPPNPILFAQLFSEKHTIRIRINNNCAALTQTDNTCFNKRINIDIFLCGPLYIFLTPSQIALLQNLLSLLVPKEKEQQSINPANYGGLPMKQEHFDRLMQQVQGDSYGIEQQHKFGEMFTGTWSGAEQFYDFSEMDAKMHKKHDFPISRIRSNSLDTEKGMGQKNHRYTSSTSTLIDKRPDIFSFSIRAPILVALITHEDPLSMSSVRKNADVDINQIVQNLTKTMVAKSDHFFKTAALLKLGKNKIHEQRAMLANLYDRDCLRFVANDFFTTCSFISESQRNLMEIEGHLDNCDFVECLKMEEHSIVIDIMNLSAPIKGIIASQKSGLTFHLKNTVEKQNDYALNIEMEHCKTELDPSILDRIANLIFIQPFFSSQKSPVITENIDIGAAPLDDKLLLDDAQTANTFAVKSYCSNWLLNLRIPVADLSKEIHLDTLNLKRKLYPEYLEFHLEGALLELPKSLLTDLPICGTLNLQCRTAKGKFIGDPNVLECTNEQMTFIYAETTNAERTMGNVNGVRLKISYDQRNKSLSQTLLNTQSFTKSFSDSVFSAANRNKIEGPFSTKDTFHFKDGSKKNTSEPSQRLIKAGNRDELMEFAEECRSLSNFLVDISINQLNLSLPSRKFFEILYNRLANDLALWEPKSPKYRNNQTDEHKKNREFIECQSAFASMQTENDEPADDFDTEEPHYATKQRNLQSNGKIESHKFSIGFHVERARILLQTRNNLDMNDKFISQLCTDMVNADFFMVYGFRGDLNLSYIFCTSTNAELSHKNLIGNEAAYHENVLDSQTFIIPKLKENIYLSEVPMDHDFERFNNDNFVVSLKIHFHEETNKKEILLAFGLRNSLIYFRPFEKLEYFWATQFADFFNVVDYGVPGYIPPAVYIDLRIHFNNVFLGYDHSSIIPSSPFQIRLELGSSYICTYLVPNIERLKFDCIFEDLNFYMRKKMPQSVKFEATPKFRNSPNNFVKLLMADSIHFIISYSLVIDQSLGPLIDFACTDQNLALWLCTDTIIEFLNILKEISNSDTVKNLLISLEKSRLKKEQQISESAMPEQLPPKVRKESVNELIDTTSKGREHIRRNVSINEHERLIRDMESAMNEMPIVYHTNTKKYMMMEDAMMRDEDLSPQLTTTENTDDEFLMIDKVPTRRTESRQGIGITQIDRFQTHFDTGGDFELITTQVNISSGNQQTFDEPTDPSTLLISYKLKIASMTIYLFGGSDFSDRALPSKPYSQWKSNRDLNSFQETGTQGGQYRDHTVFVEFKFTRLRTICKIFNESSPFLSSILLELGDFNIIDHLSISQINEMVHRLEIEGKPRSSAPFLKVLINEDQLREAICKISLAPIRINLDQHTFLFLMDYNDELARGLIYDITTVPQKSEQDDDDGVPVMEMPKPSSTDDISDEESGKSDENEENLYPDLSKGTSMSFKDLQERDDSIINNLEELFSEEDVILSDSVYEEKFACQNNLTNQVFGEDDEQPFKEEEKSTTTTTSSNAYAKNLAAKTTFIKDFTFSPACRIRIDYEAKGHIIAEQQSTILALLIGVTNLKKAELVLKEIKTEKGFLGFDRCAQYVIDEWTNDIKNKQLKNVVGGVAVINALVQLAQGFNDLVACPLEEYQRVDGQLARGIQKGTTSFGLNAASAALDATQRVVNIVQNIAELTYDILNPNFVYQQGTQRMQQIPEDLREGISLACNTVREGFADTAQTFQTAAERDRACGGWGIGIIRHITPTAIKPIVVVSKATSHMIGGLKNQLKPEEHKEEMRKWRHNAVAKQGFDQFRRQSSSSSFQQQPQTSSSGSYNKHI